MDKIITPTDGSNLGFVNAEAIQAFMDLHGDNFSDYFYIDAFNLVRIKKCQYGEDYNPGSHEYIVKTESGYDLERI